MWYIKHEEECFIIFLNTEKLVENTRFLADYEVFGNLIKHSRVFVVFLNLILFIYLFIIILPHTKNYKQNKNDNK